MTWTRIPRRAARRSNGRLASIEAALCGPPGWIAWTLSRAKNARLGDPVAHLGDADDALDVRTGTAGRCRGRGSEMRDLGTHRRDAPVAHHQLVLEALDERAEGRSRVGEGDGVPVEPDDVPLGESVQTVLQMGRVQAGALGQGGQVAPPVAEQSPVDQLLVDGEPEVGEGGAGCRQAAIRCHRAATGRVLRTGPAGAGWEATRCPA